MSNWAALVGSDLNGGLQRSHLAPGRVPVGRGDAITVILATSADLNAWSDAAPEGSTIDRGRKHPSKPLSLYLPGNGRCVRLETGYRDPGQTERGVKAMLTAAVHRHRSGVMLLGVGKELFDRLWARAADGEKTPVEFTAEESDIPRESATGELRRLIEDNPNLTVPDELRRKFVGNAPVSERVRKLIMLAARCAYPVLVEGESGTGKEIVARQIHDRGPRSTQSFMVVNCGGIPDELLESELFGHVQGAFTGAVRNKQGLWTLADEGTLFLDEIGDLSMRHQVKVLRALEDGTYRPVGGDNVIHSNARVIAATHRNLSEMVAAGRFREDLYYRLFALRIRTPALREHPSDIPDLATFLWSGIANESAAPLPATVLGELQRHAWPGNVRELRAFLINLAVYTDGRPVTAPLVRELMSERRGGGS